MSTTEVVWTYSQFFDVNLNQALDNKIQEMVNAGKTNGQTTASIVENYNRLVTRWWNSLEFAQEWISFCNNYNPVSATIVS